MSPNGLGKLPDEVRRLLVVVGFGQRRESRQIGEQERVVLGVVGFHKLNLSCRLLLFVNAAEFLRCLSWGFIGQPC
jgi:hypothetical protein